MLSKPCSSKLFFICRAMCRPIKKSALTAAVWIVWQVAAEGGIVASVDGMDIGCRALVNCAGLSAIDLAASVQGSTPSSVPEAFFAKGNYFRYAGVCFSDVELRHRILNYVASGARLCRQVAGLNAARVPAPTCAGCSRCAPFPPPGLPPARAKLCGPRRARDHRPRWQGERPRTKKNGTILVKYLA